MAIFGRLPSPSPQVIDCDAMVSTDQITAPITQREIAQLHSMLGARLFQSVLMNDATMRAAPVEMNTSTQHTRRQYLVHRYLCAFELRRLC